MAEEGYRDAVARRMAEIERERAIHRLVMVEGGTDPMRRGACGCGLEAELWAVKLHQQTLEQEWALPPGVKPPDP